MFAEQLKQVMSERKITQTELSRLTGLSISGISQYLSKKIKPPVNTQKRIADALNMELTELTEPTGAAPPDTKTLPAQSAKRITPLQASRLLGQSAEMVRLALQQGVSPFGYACKGKCGRWVYHISPGKLNEYMKETMTV
ncbi:hypothetical protein FACS189490_14210 [Clostridia bacterium]|nr:hypothetical protein FACS189490_14210 [Clostridia bacterium]